MNWVEELTPDDDVEVEIIYPKFYVDHNMATMKKYSAAAAYYCRAAWPAAFFLHFRLPHLWQTCRKGWLPSRTTPLQCMV